MLPNVQPFVFHTHFYQPERANPWTHTLDPEPGAAPFRDWNERIHHECYRANAFARIYDAQRRIERIVNAYDRLSFDFGPTLLSWLERHHPATYERIRAADRAAVARCGHGNALAQSFHHTILPLDSPRDRRTQVRWGIADFRHRFGRAPEGMWLPEAAISPDVADLLIEEGVRYTILAPRQAARLREDGGRWKPADGAPDASRAWRVQHSTDPSRHLTVLFYDGALAQRLAFDPKAMESAVMVDSLAGAATGGLVHAAMDGETFGHHHRFGDLGLAYTLNVEAPERGFEPTNYGSWLEQRPPAGDAEIVGGEGSSWSCAHGVGRWSRDCGCSTDAEAGWNQRWRAPLRAALDVVRDAAVAAFADRGAELLRDPWAARDAYVDVIVGARDREGFLAEHARPGLPADRRPDVWTALEAQRNAMAMYTSCGWFFADVSGIETVYVMRFAARTMELHEALGVRMPRAEVLDRLGEARSNRPHVGSGADVWLDSVVPSTISHHRVAGQVVLQAAAGHTPQADGHDVALDVRRWRSGEATLLTGTVTVSSEATTRTASFAVAGLALGALDVQAWLGPAEPDTLRTLEGYGNRLHASPVPRLVAALDNLLGEPMAVDDAMPSGRAAFLHDAEATVTRRLREAVRAAHAREARTLDLLRQSGRTATHDVRAVEAIVLAEAVTSIADELPDPRDTDAVTAWLERVDRLPRAHDQQRRHLRLALEHLATDVVRIAVARPTADHVDAVAAVVAMADDRGIELDLGRAQEAVHDDLAHNRALRSTTHVEAMARLGELIGLSPTLWRRD